MTQKPVVEICNIMPTILFICNFCTSKRVQNLFQYGLVPASIKRNTGFALTLAVSTYTTSFFTYQVVVVMIIVIMISIYLSLA